MKRETAIERYRKRSLHELKNIAVKVFHAFIRERDKNLKCISCGKGSPEQAGHFLSAGQNPGVKFHEHNVNGQCVQCNYYFSGNLANYREGLIKKIGETNVIKLEQDAAEFKQKGFKWDKDYLIEIILKYRSLIQ